jgi:glyoxylase-like metal-dependent hydrolase (beta-lactamase superfamily II)
MPLLPLKADVYVSPGIQAKPIRGEGRPFDWSPIASTLIRGEYSAVLVDTAITIKQNKDLADWVESLLEPRNISLATIYITHGHADHFLGLSILQSRFPGAKVVATQGTIQHMKQQIDPAFFGSFWQKFFPGRLPEPVMTVEALPDDGKFELEGHVLQAVEVGHTDTTDTTVLWVPDLKLAVCGDVVYGDVHQYLVEANTREKRMEWIAALEKVKALGPETVVAGHKRPGGLDGVFNLDASIQYIRDFQNLIDDGVKDAKVLYEKMMEKYGGRVNSQALLGGCRAAVKSLPKL